VRTIPETDYTGDTLLLGIFAYSGDTLLTYSAYSGRIAYSGDTLLIFLFRARFLRFQSAIKKSFHFSDKGIHPKQPPCSFIFPIQFYFSVHEHQRPKNLSKVYLPSPAGLVFKKILQTPLRHQFQAGLIIFIIKKCLLPPVSALVI